MKPIKDKDKGMCYANIIYMCYNILHGYCMRCGRLVAKLPHLYLVFSLAK